VTAVFQPLVAEVQTPRLVRTGEEWALNYGNDQLPTLAMANAKSLKPPDTMHRLQVHALKQRVNSAKAVAWISPGQFQYLLSELGMALPGRTPEGRPGKTHHTAGANLRETRRQKMVRDFSSLGGTHHFPFATSL
jgi:hypothetical protein